MVTVLTLLGVLGVLFAAAVLSTREQGLLAEASSDAPDVPLPTDPLTPEDVHLLRFSMAARGYRMSEVDLALERLAHELADRDRRIGLLEAAARGKATPVPVAPVREATPRDLPVPEERAVPSVVVAPQPVPAPSPHAQPQPQPQPRPDHEPDAVAAAPVGEHGEPAEELAPTESLVEPPAPEPQSDHEPDAVAAAPVGEQGEPAEELAPTESRGEPPAPELRPAPAWPGSPVRAAAWSNPSAVPAFPVIDAPETDISGTHTSGTDAPGTDASGTDAPGTDAPAPQADPPVENRAEFEPPAEDSTRPH